MMEQPTPQSQERDVDEPSWIQGEGVYDAVIDGTWSIVKTFFDDSFAFTFRITESGDTALLVAIKAGQKGSFIKKMVDKTPPGLLTQKDNYGNTSLHAAAKLGNVKIAVLLVNKNHELLSFLNDDGLLPIQVSANQGRKEMNSARYLQEK